jgi:hypothetical protein
VEPHAVTIQVDGRGRVMLVLLAGILDLVRNSPATDVQARCALKAALEMLPEMYLEQKPCSLFGSENPEEDY